MQSRFCWATRGGAANGARVHASIGHCQVSFIKGKSMTLPDGLYDLLVTERLSGQLDESSSRIQSLPRGASALLVEAISRQLVGILEDLPDDAHRANHQLALMNGMLIDLRQRIRTESGSSETVEVIDLLASPLRVLKGIQSAKQFHTAPEIGLSRPWLFTAGKGSPSLLQEIRLELASCDRVDILVSFITVSGVRKLQDVLQQITALNAAGQQAARVRILTTTYTGATEAQALDQLARLPGCEVRISLDGRRTRLHAKAWLFHRESGFGSAYVGSANLSGAALTGGLEWTVKLTQRTQGSLFSRAAAHFETLWADNEFQSYNPDNPEHRRALVTALGRESFGAGESGNVITRFFDLQPKPYQQDMLEQLSAERLHGRRRNLVVAATGTGKTIVAAFDYRNTSQRVGGRPRLLFVAHREEILLQAQRAYREVLRDPEFGQLLVGSRAPIEMDHLFATIDSMSTRGLVNLLGGEYWHTVVIDECHRLAADRFDTFVRAVRPNILLGLTATPERSDGQPIDVYFDQRPDGSPAVELRLWHALDLQLLAPFEYYACDDETDFAAVPWQQAGEREAIDKLVTGNDIRAKLVIREWQRLTANPLQSKALVFCVSVAHAEFMTAWLNQAGLPAVCVVGTSSPEIRKRAPQRLLNGEICALVTVDLYNEGIDLPMVDTLLLLRPTQSPVLFQQQIGRGLRLSPGKESCLVLDFVGQHRVDFRYDRLLSSLTGLSRRELATGVESGFGSLPPGCHIQLQRQTREQVLQSLRTLTTQSWRWLKAELQSYAALRGRAGIGLADFLHEQALDLDDVYRNATGQGRSGWTALQRDAGLLVSEPGPEEDYFSRRPADVLHVEDPVRLACMKDISGRAEQLPLTMGRAQQCAQMLAYQIDGRHEQLGSGAEFADRLRRHSAICEELAGLTDILESRSTLPFVPVPGLEDTPMCLHAAYGIREILTAVGFLSAARRTPFQAGVLRLVERKTELLFVTLDKAEGYHESIAYHDYAISAERFHWQTQNSAGPDTRSGMRYLGSPQNGWHFQLFVRVLKGDPYRACGPVVQESVLGDRPMTVVWKLLVPLPIKHFREFSVLRGV